MSGSRIDMKIVLLGREYGGKTSLVERYLHGRFDGQCTYQSTIGAAFGAKKLNIDGQSITLGIWDTAGSERYESMSRIYYRGAKAAIICFDLTDKTSYEKVEFWVKELKQNEVHCSIYFCGTKRDLVNDNKDLRQVDQHNVQDHADSIEATYFETSSKTGENLEELFHKIAQDFKKTTVQETDESSFKIEDSPKKKKINCCITS